MWESQDARIALQSEPRVSGAGMAITTRRSTAHRPAVNCTTSAPVGAMPPILGRVGALPLASESLLARTLNPRSYCPGCGDWIVFVIKVATTRYPSES